MPRFVKENINPELLKERAKATFDREQITYLLDGGQFLTEKRREMEALAYEDKALTEVPDFNFLSRPERYNEAMRKAGHYIRTLKGKPSVDRADSHFYGNLVFPNEISPIGLHGGMFIPTLEAQGTKEQTAKWLPKAYNYEMIGTYAQTELGHGTNVRGLETTATYDPRSEEFVLHSPTLTSLKWWPGGLGKTCNHAIVMALLFTKGECHGMHGFLVQLRDYTTHQPLQGVSLGDIGPKYGFDTIDNGFLRLTHLRIPRDNMLMKSCQVLKDGTYIKPKSDKHAYGAMIFVRAMIVLDQAGRGIAQAATIAIRYSCVRRQSELKPGELEPQILDFQTQQYKLLPLLASAYAYWFAGLKMRETYFMLNYEIQQGNIEALPELHASSSGLKAFTSYGAMSGIEVCRLACGGHGYSQASGIPKIYVQTTAACTYEGENTVLYLQTARYLVKAYQQSQQQQQQQPPSGGVSYLFERRNKKSTIGAGRLTVDTLVDAYKHRATGLIASAYKKYARLQAEGKESYHAWNLTSVELAAAAEAHCHLYVIEAFVEKISNLSDASVSAVLYLLFELYAAFGISNSAAELLADGYLSSQQLDIVNERILHLLTEIRPNAVGLVDSFDFTDRLLGSILGRYDGNVYENLYKWARESPLNKSEVHDSFKYLKPHLQTSKL